MGFTDGQLIFAAIFFFAFIIFIGFAYRKDIKMGKNLSKGTWKVLAGVVGTFLLFYLVVKLLS